MISGINNPNFEKDIPSSDSAKKNDLKILPIIEKKDHPYILLTDSALTILKQESKTDVLLQRYANDVIILANSMLNKPLLKYNNNDLWFTTEMTREYLTNLCFAYRWTGEEKYAIVAKKVILNAVSFPDWTPIPGFLQTSEMTCAVAIGYDWLFEWLDPISRTSIENAILNYGLKEYLLADVNRTWLTKRSNNFGIANNSCMVIGAVAIGKLYPEILKKVLQTALNENNLPLSIKLYSPDGAWNEGIHYWGFSTYYAILGIEVLKTATGSDFGLSNTQGFSNTGYFNIYTLSNNGIRLHFGDDYTNEKGDEPTKSLFWLGKRFNNQFFINEEHKKLYKKIADPFHVIYYASQKIENDQRNLDRFFDGTVPVVTFRSKWDDMQALFLGAKGGQNNLGHGHLDLGNFEMEALGIRWADDLGTDNYDLPGYFSDWTLNSAQRWTYYRCNSHSHNVPMINNNDQLVNGNAIVLSHKENIEEPYIKFDLSSAYATNAKSVTRDIRIINNRNSVQVTDVFNLKAQAEIYWGITTPANIQILTNGEAILTSKGKMLKAKIVSPSGLNFYSESCIQVAPQALNFGYSRLMIKTNQPSGITELKITLSPVFKDVTP